MKTVLCSPLREGIEDILLGFKYFNVAFFFAWGDIKARYRRSILGPWWLVLSTAISVAGLGFLWSILLKDDPVKLVPSLTVGLVIWQLLSNCIVEAPSIFVRNANFIRNIKLPFFLFPQILLIRHLIVLAHSFLIILLVIAYFGIVFKVEQFLIIPGLVLIFANLSWITVLLALFGSRFRDIEQIISAIMPILFFLSPIIYRPSQLPQAQILVWMNPFSYLITLIRDPIMGMPPPIFVYQISILALLIGGIFTIYVLGKYRSQITFWI